GLVLSGIKTHQRPGTLFAARDVVEPTRGTDEKHVTSRSVWAGIEELFLTGVVGEELHPLRGSVFAVRRTTVEDQAVRVQRGAWDDVLGNGMRGDDFRLPGFRMGAVDPIAEETVGVVGGAGRTAVAGVIEPTVAADVDAAMDFSGQVVHRR